ncbi:conserved protein of unknown function [Denitratisoma oestradiolicum]|uniref:Uncharacterized protein n=1 Tax=Denitratisoma oestradiolicum TaxID=311182 RepID=A0A6S6XQ99_9PROT|nr:conserved protein of unknown function [Denitratisoma oestradiolicum]
MVHPRACGEHRTPSNWTCWETGSSPRMRGTRARSKIPPLERRFIPAHAGNTNPEAMEESPITVHPRACGEHKAIAKKLEKEGGSSPRMRGTRWIRIRPHGINRFIPAHAGNTGAFVL